METECFAVSVQDPFGSSTKHLLLYPGIPGREVQQALHSAFPLVRCQVAGLLDPVLDIYFPLTLVSRAPKYFATRTPCRIVPEHNDNNDSPRLLSRSKGRVGNALRVLSLSPPQLYERQEQLAALPDDALSRESFKEIQRGALGEEPEQQTCSNEGVPAGEVLSGLPAVGGRDGRKLDGGAEATNESNGDGDDGPLMEMVQHVVCKGTAVQQITFESNQTQGPERSSPRHRKLPPTLGLTELRDNLRISGYRADKVLEELCATVASDGKLTRAEFDICLKSVAASLEIATHASANGIFALFDGEKKGILHVRDMASGLAVLCDGCTAPSILIACRLYGGASGDMGFSEIAGFTTSIFKVLYAASPDDWARLGMLPHELAAATSSEYLVRKGLPLSGRVNFSSLRDWFVLSVSEGVARNTSPRDGDDWVYLLRHLRKHDTRVVLELLSTFVDQDGSVSLPAFYGCMRALVEVDECGVTTEPETANLKMAIKKLYNILDVSGQGGAPFRDLASGVSMFCDNDNNAKVRALFDIYGNEDDSIAEQDARSFFNTAFKILFEVEPGARFGTGSGTRGLQRVFQEQVGPAHLAEKTAARAFEDATLRPDGSMSFDEFRRWYSSPVEMASPNRPAEESNTLSREETPDTTLDVEEIHRVFRLRDVHVADVVEGLTEVASGGRVSWLPFLRFMCGLADIQPLRRDSCPAVAMARKIFNVFDEEKKQEVDVRVLASGLSILCKGSWKDRVASLFSLLDVERLGSLTSQDMHTYFCATLKLLCSAQPGTTDASNPNTLARTMVAEAFKASRARNGHAPERFDREMFCALLSRTDQERKGSLLGGSWDGREAERLMSAGLTHARQHSRLCAVSVESALRVFSRGSNYGGFLSRPTVHACFRRIRAMVEDGTQSNEREALERGHDAGGERNDDAAAAEGVADRLFVALDVNNAGEVDLRELASGVSVLCGGTRDEKMRAIFGLFDRGGRGGITGSELAIYLTSAFRVMYKLQPGLEEEVGIPPAALGNVTSVRAMEEVARDEDGRISPHEFGSWFSTAGVLKGGAEGIPGRSEPGLASPAPSSGKVEQAESANLWWDQVNGHSHSMMRARKLLCLDCFNVNDLMEMFAEVAVMGTLSLDDFWRCIGYALQLGGMEEGGEGWDEASLLAERIHHAFEDRDDMVDFAAITSGVSILCQSSLEEKSLVAFVLFDTDADGKLTFEEVTMYMASVLRVVYAVSEDATGIADPDELGASLASQCFGKAQLSVDASLGIDDFRRFLG